VGRRIVRITSWTAGKRTLNVDAGPATYVQVAQNFNPGWAATLNNQALKPVRLDGWEQGWILPAGRSGTMTMTFSPDQPYRVGLLVGALFLIALLLLAFTGRKRSRSDPIGPRKKLPGLVLGGAAAIIAFCVGGVLVLTLVPLIAVACRWGSRVLGVIAAVAFVLGGIIVAIHPDIYPFGYPLSEGAFGAPAQICAVVALCAVLSAVVVEDRQSSPD